MPIYLKNNMWYYISRRSLCDNCTIQNTCEEADSKERCPYFRPKVVMFVECRKCRTMFEIHEIRKMKWPDVCPTCQEKEWANEAEGR